MARLFGTDGVRGLANKEVTAELALHLGEAAARKIGISSTGGAKPRAVIGRDTRISGEFIDHAIASGLASAGMDVTRIGVVTTPTVAHLTASEGIALGVMISASHNPMPDNGIKFFGSGGFKLQDTDEDDIESILRQDWDRPIGAEVGEIHYEDDWADHSYIEHLVHSIDCDLRGLRIAVDCANGSASELGPLALREAGADVVVINASPDGRNINDQSGSTHPEQLQAVTVASHADLGVAYDGDADRCLAVDRNGNLIDGDKIMGSLAIHMKDKGLLDKDTLVVTVMSNLGLILAMEEQGINTVQTAVGDRYVLEEMLSGGYSLGGEQSGHVINRHSATTGDGILTSMMLAAMVHETGRDLADLVANIQRLPQTLINVGGVDKARTSSNQPLQDAIAAAEKQLGHGGRVVLRSSGTEPLVRVMVEAGTHDEAASVAEHLAGIVRAELSL